MTKLSNVLSEVIVQAVNDLQLCMEDKAYNIEMSEWHSPKNNGVCNVCLAGSVIAKSLETAADELRTPYFYEDNTLDKLDALNYIRKGEIKEATRIFYAFKKSTQNIKDRRVAEYNESPETFIEEMLDVAKYLKSKGL